MADRATRQDASYASESLEVGAKTLLLINRLVRHSHCGSNDAWCTFAKEPYALVFRDTAGVHAVSTGGNAVSLEELRTRMPSIVAALEAL